MKLESLRARRTCTIPQSREVSLSAGNPPSGMPISMSQYPNRLVNQTSCADGPLREIDLPA